MRTGLPATTITGFVQSQDGYLWLTTFDGLVRFDGVRFTVFNSATSPSLPTNRLIGLLEDGAGRLWVRTEAGHLLERRGRDFVDHSSGVGGATVRDWFGDPDGTLWVASNEGIFRIDHVGSEAVLRGIVEEPPVALHLDSNEGLWIGTEGGEVYRATARGEVDVELMAVLDDDQAHLISVAPDGSVWIGGRNGAYRIAEGELTNLPPLPPGRWVIRFHVPKPEQPVDPGAASSSVFDTSPWIETWEGPLALVGGRWIDPTETPGGGLAPVVGTVGPDGARWAVAGTRVYRDGELLLTTARRVERVHFDTEGTTWAWGDGLHKLRPALLEQMGEAHGFVDNVYVVHEDLEGRIWMGSMGGGLVRIDGGRIDRLPTDPATSGLSSIALAVHQDRAGDVWVGLWDGGVCRLLDDRCPADRIHRLDGTLVRGIFEDRSGNLWFGTSAGVYTRDPGGEWHHLGVADGLRHPDVRVFAEAPDGALWMGTYGGGLARWDGRAVTSFGDEAGLSSTVIRSLFIDGEGVIWAGTEGRGLNRIVPNGSGPPSVTVLRASDGLYDDGIHQIVEDDFGRLWMSTNRGLFWVRKSEMTDFAEGRTAIVHSISYTERHGLLDRELNGGVQGAGIRDRRGTLWFGGIAGIVRVDPSSIGASDLSPPVTLEEVIAGGRAHSLEGRRVELAAQDRDFEIRYTALSFIAPEHLRFRYRLEGFNDRWVEAGARRAAFFTNVPPGEYTFRVAVSNLDGHWSDSGAEATVVVAPYFHETPIARGAALLLVGLLGVTALRRRERRLHRQAEELEALVADRTATVEAQAHQLRELDEAKSRFFANISHEFRTPLTLTMGPLEDLRDGFHGHLPDGAREDVELALRSSRRLLRLVDQLLDVARLEAGQMEMRASRAPIERMIGRIVDVFRPLADRKGIALRHRVAPGLPEVYFDPDLMEKVFTNLLSNALKFTPAGGTVRVSVDGAGDGVAVSVKDSGCGIPEAEIPHVFDRFRRGRDVGGDQGRSSPPGAGIGLSLVREFVQLHGGTVTVRSEEGFGSTFTVAMRSGAEHLSAEVLAPEDREQRTRPDIDLHFDRTLEDRATDDVTVASGEPNGDPDQPLVLLVDDDPDVRAFVRRHLQSRFRVVEAGDGTAALTLARAELPDLVVSDILMPGLDGFQLVEALRGDPELSEVLIILLTARGEVVDRVRGLEVGADDYLPKPFEPAELRARVESLFRGRARIANIRPQIHLHPGEVTAESQDERFLRRLRTAIEEHIADEEFDVEALARAMACSRSALYRRLGELNVGSPADLIPTMRLERGAQLLEARVGSVSRVAYSVGFKSVSHFSRAFRERYGATPSAFRDAARSTRSEPSTSRPDGRREQPS